MQNIKIYIIYISEHINIDTTTSPYQRDTCIAIKTQFNGFTKRNFSLCISMMNV